MQESEFPVPGQYMQLLLKFSYRYGHALYYQECHLQVELYHILDRNMGFVLYFSMDRAAHTLSVGVDVAQM